MAGEPIWPQERPASIPPRFRQPDVVPQSYVTTASAAKMARFQLWRGFRMGLTLGLSTAALVFVAWQASAETVSISGSMVSIAPSDVPGELAVVTFENVSVNGAQDNGAYLLAMPGLTVEVGFEWETGIFGQDTVTILPPDGVICRPASCEAEVLEGFTGRIVLLEWIGG